MLKNLPIGIQSFADLRKNNYLYVDKTEHIHRMTTTGKPYFLSRPRRFGKSLFASTLEALFLGERDLFEGLYICDKWDWTRKHPVLRLDFGGTSNRSAEALKNSLSDFVNVTASRYGLSLVSTGTNDRFAELVAKLHELTGLQVVAIIDEYDKPIIDNLTDLKLADGLREILHDFYQVLKSADEHLRFIFLTGVSKFSKVSVFSGLNNLEDISLDPQYASVCGYTQEELETNFAPYVERLAELEKSSRREILDKIRLHYDGYSWDGETFVYNPFSTLLLFKKNMFADYWFDSGTPTFIVDLLGERNEVKDITEPFEMSAVGFDSFEIARIDLRILMFQAGYLTIRKKIKNRFSPMPNYLLDVPNKEVESGLRTHLLARFSNRSVSETATMTNTMMNRLLDGDATALERALRELFARIPYQLHVPREAYYHSMFLLWLSLLGFETDAEVSTDKGRIDAVWTWDERVVVAEVKYSVEGSVAALLDEAMNQIRERRYYERYAGAPDKRVALLAVAFAGKEIACRMEEL